MICLHCNKEVFSKLLSTCPHCGKSLEGYTGTTEELNELERNELEIRRKLSGLKDDGPNGLKLFLLAAVIVIIGLFVLAFMFGGSYGWGGAGAP